MMQLCLYIAGDDSTSRAAVANFRRITEDHLAGRVEPIIIDVFRNPELARECGVMATPMLVRRRPAPVRKVIGDLSDTERVLAALGLHPGDSELAYGEEQRT